MLSYFMLQIKTKVKKKFLVPLVVFLILLIGYAFYKDFNGNSKEICVENKTCFSIEVADSLDERKIGLSDKNSIEENEGMLFIFQQEEIPGFWMKDMGFPIDIVWIDKNMKITGIEKSLEPCEEGKECPVFYPSRNIMYVLEISSGLSDKYGFEEGDSVYLR